GGDNSDFPFVIDFYRGAVQFAEGDEIVIKEVRSTSKDLRSGICRITGTYNLASEGPITLAASVTASDPENGKGPWNTAQRMDITKGKGSFTLLLPISVKGSPHVSFYTKSASIGGVYFSDPVPVASRTN